MLRSYRKELVSNAFFVNGAPVQFEVLDGNRGVITLDSDKNQPLITALDAAAAARRGGIVRISEEEAANLKKNWPYNPSKSRSRSDMLRPAFQRKPQSPAPAAAEANAKPAIPLIPGVTAPANAASVAANPIAPANPQPQTEPVFKPATRRIRRNPSPVEQPPPVQTDAGV